MKITKGYNSHGRLTWQVAEMSSLREKAIPETAPQWARVIPRITGEPLVTLGAAVDPEDVLVVPGDVILNITAMGHDAFVDLVGGFAVRCGEDWCRVVFYSTAEETAGLMFALISEVARGPKMCEPPNEVSIPGRGQGWRVRARGSEVMSSSPREVELFSTATEHSSQTPENPALSFDGGRLLYLLESGTSPHLAAAMRVAEAGKNPITKVLAYLCDKSASKAIVIPYTACLAAAMGATLSVNLGIRGDLSTMWGILFSAFTFNAVSRLSLVGFLNPGTWKEKAAVTAYAILVGYFMAGAVGKTIKDGKVRDNGPVLLIWLCPLVVLGWVWLVCLTRDMKASTCVGSADAGRRVRAFFLYLARTRLGWKDLGLLQTDLSTFVRCAHSRGDVRRIAGCQAGYRNGVALVAGSYVGRPSSLPAVDATAESIVEFLTGGKVADHKALLQISEEMVKIDPPSNITVAQYIDSWIEHPLHAAAVAASGDGERPQRGNSVRNLDFSHLVGAEQGGNRKLSPAILRGKSIGDYAVATRSKFATRTFKPLQRDNLCSTPDDICRELGLTEDSQQMLSPLIETYIIKSGGVQVGKFLDDLHQAEYSFVWGEMVSFGSVQPQAQPDFKKSYAAFEVEGMPDQELSYLAGPVQGNRPGLVCSDTPNECLLSWPNASDDEVADEVSPIILSGDEVVRLAVWRRGWGILTAQPARAVKSRLLFSKDEIPQARPGVSAGHWGGRAHWDRYCALSAVVVFLAVEEGWEAFIGALINAVTVCALAWCWPLQAVNRSIASLRAFDRERTNGILVTVSALTGAALVAGVTLAAEARLRVELSHVVGVSLFVIYTVDCVLVLCGRAMWGRGWHPGMRDCGTASRRGLFHKRLVPTAVGSWRLERVSGPPTAGVGSVTPEKTIMVEGTPRPLVAGPGGVVIRLD